MYTFWIHITEMRGFCEWHVLYLHPTKNVKHSIAYNLNVRISSYSLIIEKNNDNLNF